MGGVVESVVEPRERPPCRSFSTCIARNSAPVITAEVDTMERDTSKCSSVSFTINMHTLQRSEIVRAFAARGELNVKRGDAAAKKSKRL